MDVNFWSDVAQSPFVWAICCIILAVAVIGGLRMDGLRREKEQRKDSRERENKLMTHLERSNESQERTAATLETMSHTLQAVEGRVDRVEKILYRREN